MSDISCDCSVDTGGICPSVHQKEWRRARKQHTCGECGDPISVGERHEYVSGLWDGRWDSHRTCAPCVAVRMRYCAHGFIYGGLAEQIEECLGFDYREVPERDEEEAEEAERQKWARRGGS